MDAACSSGITFFVKEFSIMTSPLFKRFLTLAGVTLLSGAALTACDKPATPAAEDTTAAPQEQAPAADTTPMESPAPQDDTTTAPETAPDSGSMMDDSTGTAPDTAAPESVPGDTSAPSDDSDTTLTPGEQQEQQ
jgi:hypothetical protein